MYPKYEQESKAFQGNVALKKLFSFDIKTNVRDEKVSKRQYQKEKGHNKTCEQRVVENRNIDRNVLDMTQNVRTSHEIRFQQQEKMNALMKQSILKPILHNLNHKNYLKDQQINQIKTILQLSQDQLYENVIKMMKNQDVEEIGYIIKWNIINWNQESQYQGKNIKLVTKNKNIRKTLSQKLQNQLNKISECSSRTSNQCSSRTSNCLYVVALFYKALKKGYSPPIKRFLMKILQTIEIIHQNNSGIYLRGALSMFESKDISPSTIASILSAKKPERSQEFLSSKQSKIKHIKTIFLPDEEVDALVEKELMKIHNKLKTDNFIFDCPPRMSFVKLRYSQFRKTVTFMISGFLSQQSAKDMEWMRMIHLLHDSQVYAVRWQSSTMSQLGLGLVRKIITFGQQGDTFGKAFHSAEKTGMYLAQFLIAHFSDRFINLVGFSLGTRVIYCCLKHLLFRRRSDLINRVITLGGVADHDEFQWLLKKSQFPLDLLNIRSDRDLVLAKILSRWNNYIKPIGLHEIMPVPGHSVRDIDLSKIVQGHLKYVDHHYLIGKMGDIIHD